MRNTWRTGEPTAFTPLSPSDHRIDYIALAKDLARVFNSARSMIMFRYMSDSRLRDVGEEVGSGTLHAQDGTVRRCVGQALMDSNIVNSDLPLDDWCGSVMGIIQHFASHRLRRTSKSFWGDIFICTAAALGATHSGLEFISQ